MTLFFIIITLAAIFLHCIFIGSVIYAIHMKKVFKPVPFDNNFNPRCSIILPCKGYNEKLNENLCSFLEMDYSNYEVVFSIESDKDTALPTIEKLISENKNCRLVIAGKSTNCGQKNHNLVKAVESVTDSEILIFADSDIKLFPNWIKSICSPLIANKATAVTGFRWLYPTEKRMGDLAHSLQNFILYSLFVAVAHKADKGLWGGSMAIRKSDYERLNVKETWQKTSVDDLSLSQLIVANNEKVFFAYDCITPTPDTICSFREATRWFQRQMMYSKYHLKFEWWCSVLSAGFIIYLNLLLPYALLCKFTGGSFFQNGGITWLVHIFLTIVLSFFFPALGEKGKHFNFILASPVSFISASLGTLATIFTNVIDWSGVKYVVRFRDGVVLNVEHPKEDN